MNPKESSNQGKLITILFLYHIAVCLSKKSALLLPELKIIFH